MEKVFLAFLLPACSFLLIIQCEIPFCNPDFTKPLAFFG